MRASSPYREASEQNCERTRQRAAKPQRGGGKDFPCPLHTRVLSREALAWPLATPPNGELAGRLTKTKGLRLKGYFVFHTTNLKEENNHGKKAHKMKVMFSLMMAKNGRDKFKKKCLACLLLPVINPFISTSLCMYQLLFSEEVLVEPASWHMLLILLIKEWMEKLFIASLFSQPKLEVRNVTIRGRNLFIFFSLPRQQFGRSSS